MQKIIKQQNVEAKEKDKQKADTSEYGSFVIECGEVVCPSCGGNTVHLIACHTCYNGSHKNGYTGHEIIGEESIATTTCEYDNVIGIAFWCEYCQKYWILKLKSREGVTAFECQKKGFLSADRGWSPFATD